MSDDPEMSQELMEVFTGLGTLGGFGALLLAFWRGFAALNQTSSDMANRSARRADELAAQMQARITLLETSFAELFASKELLKRRIMRLEKALSAVTTELERVQPGAPEATMARAILEMPIEEDPVAPRAPRAADGDSAGE